MEVAEKNDKCLINKLIHKITLVDVVKVFMGHMNDFVLI